MVPHRMVDLHGHHAPILPRLDRRLPFTMRHHQQVPSSQQSQKQVGNTNRRIHQHRRRYLSASAADADSMDAAAER